jgi:outer membrane receptor protein involved in Fe transport
MSDRHLKTALLATTAAIAAMISSNPAQAQDQTTTPQQNPEARTANAGEIIVTARKRQESLLNVPVIETVITPEQLQSHQTVDLKDLAKISPGVMVGTTVLSIGQVVTIRGVGTTSFDPGIDQSVSLNIDGLSLGQGLAFSSGMFDIGQVEVLKGPQALFYGKSSPGGVISLRTADPTDKFEVMGSVGYETEAHQMRAEGVISGPITSTLKARLAGMVMTSEGFYYNRAIGIPALGGLTPKYDRMGNAQHYQLRGTLLWDPSPKFDVRLKANYVHDNAINAENAQLTSCPDGTGPVPGLGIPFISPLDNCKKDRVGYIVDYNTGTHPVVDPVTGAVTNVPFFPGIIRNGIPFVESWQYYGTLEMNYRPVPDLTVTSVTAFYHLKSHSNLNTSMTGAAGPLLDAENPRFRRTDWTEELRVNSDFSSPLNFTLGGFFQDAKVSDRVTLLANTLLIPAGALAPLQDGTQKFKIRTWSAFGQLRYKITPELELAAGARWTDETRTQQQILYPSLTQFGLGIFSPFEVPSATPRLHSSTVSPEATLTYKPNPDLTIFASYKEASKSGSFSMATPATFLDTTGCATFDAATQSFTPIPGAINNSSCWLNNSFGDEKVRGAEAGIKGRLLDRQINFSLAGYYYHYKGLQVGGIEPTVGSVPVIRTVNAGSGRSYGVDFDVNYSPQAIEGLNLHASVNWNNTKFTQLNNVPCYGGQMVTEGCTEEFTPTLNPNAVGTVTVNGQQGYFFAQDLSGAPFVRAPRWQVNFGFDYELPIGGGKTLTFTDGNYYTSKFLAGPGLRPDFYQKAYFKMDLGLSLKGKDDKWEIAVIGKNVTNRLTTSNCSPSNFQGGLTGGEITGGTVRGPAGVDEMLCYMDPGRELWIRLTLRPTG